MKRKDSMTRRMVIALTSVVALSWLVASGLGIMVMQDEFAEIFDSSVQETAERLLPLIADDLKERSPEAERRLVQPATGEEYLTYQLRDREGEVLLRSYDSAVEPFDVPVAPGFADTPTHRIYTVGNADGSLYLQVADAFANRREAIVEAGTALILFLVFLIPASIIAVILVVRRTLAPVQTLRDEIGSKDSGNMAPVDDRHLPQELHPIARSVNLLLERLRAALESERAFASNSAHELRTPIAGALAQAQRLQADIPQAFAPRVGQIERSLSHLAQLAEKLLQMSRADAGIGTSDTHADLLPIVELVLEDIGRSDLGTGRIQLHFPQSGGLEGKINTDAFGIVMRNIVENALIHSPERSRVDVYIDDDNSLRVVNHGTPIDPALLSKLTTRFTRGATQAPGSGLGLAIVQNLVTQMKGSMHLVSPATGRSDGFEVRISLPRP
ncbi:ATP-binding protein [Agrobacterium rubi]|uniref:histidine kinase n=1 Tax=Agrobacterium rubi TaxID=28099 RepID=A0AAE7USJ7_9HYPH|nr:ATP-binding protein [Agrobacterium rubi]MCL6652832.1 two-component sensor histidine kinase [Agrobacterium rubi]NTE88570.1 HAMP domain-containing protein [Agrobacterium rubi]NTF04398.1 HAMP domain-containing protein [Agrobacterium rubi]NTF09931.1 HAMP domain-containing protein [Agrobacterium rubi]NTF21891.1 HAMP domain-containing protein [Agrobacterium rubi]